MRQAERPREPRGHGADQRGPVLDGGEERRDRADAQRPGHPLVPLGERSAELEGQDAVEEGVGDDDDAGARRRGAPLAHGRHGPAEALELRPDAARHSVPVHGVGDARPLLVAAGRRQRILERLDSLGGGAGGPPRRRGLEEVDARLLGRLAVLGLREDPDVVAAPGEVACDLEKRYHVSVSSVSDDEDGRRTLFLSLRTLFGFHGSRCQTDRADDWSNGDQY